MKHVFFVPADQLPRFEFLKLIPPARRGGVLAEWVDYYARLRSSVKRYESQTFSKAFPNVPIMCKDPYFATTSAQARKGQDERVVAQAVQTKKRKLPSKKSDSAPAPIVPPCKKSSAGSAAPSSASPKKSDVPQASGKDISPAAIKRDTPSRSPKKKKEYGVPSRASARLRAKPSANPFKKTPPPSSPSSPIVIGGVAKDSSDKQTTFGPVEPPVTQGSSVGEGLAEGEEHESPLSKHSSTPSCDVERVSDTPVRGNEDLHHSSDALSKEASLPTDGSPKAMVSVIPLPLSSVGIEQPLVLSILPVLSSFLSDDDARILSEFFSSHDSILLPENSYPVAFLRPAYSFLAEFLRFTRAHPPTDLLCVYKDKLIEDLKALSLFGFKGTWFDDLSYCLTSQGSSAAFEGLSEMTEQIRHCEQRIMHLKQQVEALKFELTQNESELSQLLAKRRGAEEACSKLNACFAI